MIVVSALALNFFHPSVFFKSPKTEPDYIVDEQGDFRKSDAVAMTEKNHCRRCRRGTDSYQPRSTRVDLRRNPSNPPYYNV